MYGDQGLCKNNTLACWHSPWSQRLGVAWGGRVRYGRGMAKTLTDRQRQVMTLFVSGMTYKQVASALGISPLTVNPTLRVCASKLGLNGISRETLRSG